MWLFDRWAYGYRALWTGKYMVAVVFEYVNTWYSCLLNKVVFFRDWLQSTAGWKWNGFRRLLMRREFNSLRRNMNSGRQFHWLPARLSQRYPMDNWIAFGIICLFIIRDFSTFTFAYYYQFNKTFFFLIIRSCKMSQEDHQSVCSISLSGKDKSNINKSKLIRLLLIRP